MLILQGLGMVVTGTLPVFNLTMDGNSQVLDRYCHGNPSTAWSNAMIFYRDIFLFIYIFRYILLSYDL